MVRKFKIGGVSSPGLLSLSLNFQPIDVRPASYFINTNTPYPNYTTKNTLIPTKVENQTLSTGIGILGNLTSGLLSNELYGDSQIGLNLGTIFSSGLSSTVNTMGNNLIKGTSLMSGLGKNLGASLGSAASGIAGNYLGQGLSSLFDNSDVAKGIGTGIGTAVGGIGGIGFLSLSQGKNFFNTFLIAKNAKAAADSVKITAATTGITEGVEDAAKTASTASKFSNWASIGGLAASAVGAGLLAGFGPSKTYNGNYGTGAMIADTAYDAASAAIGFAGPVGALISGGMALNKGLTNAFGSTDGMTLQDTIVGNSWTGLLTGGIPFLNWINMAGARTTGTFNNQSWLNTEKTNAFMLNAFGDLTERFDKARKEAGKTYGLFSKSAYNKALANLDFANNAWGKILGMTDLNEIQNIRSQAMSSINNQRYAQDIQGGWSPLYRGKQGMKILNNATNHKIGMRLLSGAALVDSKQMILCGAVD